MDTTLFIVSLACAVAAPLIAIAYLSDILYRVLEGLCNADGSAEFWIRCATLLAVTGSVLMLTLFGNFDPGTSVALALRCCLFLTMAALFATVALSSRNVWNQARLQMPTLPPLVPIAPVQPTVTPR